VCCLFHHCLRPPGSDWLFLVYKEIPDPEPKAGHVVIEIKAFGIHHAEMHMGRGEWAEAAKVRQCYLKRSRPATSGAASSFP
jgi:D-arabinose 1-dehydrogenase-like Zn-dependent alcohol dehydrogenase